jgi:hypothetical protein
MLAVLLNSCASSNRIGLLTNYEAERRGQQMFVGTGGYGPVGVSRSIHTERLEQTTAETVRAVRAAGL